MYQYSGMTATLSGQISIFGVVLGIERQTKLKINWGNKPHKLCSYSPEPRTEVYCLRLKFNFLFG